MSQFIRILLKRMAIGGIFAAIVIGAIILFDANRAEQLRQAQQTAVQRFGQAAVNACAKENLDAKPRQKLPIRLRLVVLNAQDKVVMEDYQSALPSTIQADDQNKPTYVICVEKARDDFNTDYYGDNKKYRCEQFTNDLKLFVVDIATNQTVLYRNLKGTTPEDCPDITDKNLVKEGIAPSPADLVTWLNRQFE